MVFGCVNGLRLPVTCPPLCGCFQRLTVILAPMTCCSENSWDLSASTHSPTLQAALSSLVWQSQPDNLTCGVSFVSCAMVSRYGLQRRIAMHSTSKCGIPWVASHVERCDIWRLQLSSWYPIAPTEELWVTSEVVAPMNTYIVAICNSYLVLSFHSAYIILRGLLGNSISQTIDEHERKHCITGIGSAVLSQGGDGGVTAAFSLPSFARCVRRGSAVPAAMPAAAATVSLLTFDENNPKVTWAAHSCPWKLDEIWMEFLSQLANVAPTHHFLETAFFAALFQAVISSPRSLQACKWAPQGIDQQQRKS